MDRSSVDWKGYWAAAPTPFARDGALDEGGLAGAAAALPSPGHSRRAGQWHGPANGSRRPRRSGGRVAEIAVEELEGLAFRW